MNIGKLLWVHITFVSWRTWLLGFEWGTIFSGDWQLQIYLGPLVLEIGSPLEDD